MKPPKNKQTKKHIPSCLHVNSWPEKNRLTVKGFVVGPSGGLERVEQVPAAESLAAGDGLPGLLTGHSLTRRGDGQKLAFPE